MKMPFLSIEPWIAIVKTNTDKYKENYVFLRNNLTENFPVCLYVREVWLINYGAPLCMDINTVWFSWLTILQLL